MSTSFHSCTVSRAPITKRAMVLPMGETPYKEPNEYGPWWMFSLPFFVHDNYTHWLAAPPEPGSKENNTPEEVAEAVCAATSVKFITDYIKRTNPDMTDFELVCQDDVFANIRPFSTDYLNGSLHDDFETLASNSYHFFSDKAKEEFQHYMSSIKKAIVESGAPTIEMIDEVIARSNHTTQYRLGNIRPGVVAISKKITGTKGMLHQELIDAYHVCQDEVRRVFAANPISTSWLVERPKNDYRYEELTKDPAAKTTFSNVQDVTLVVRLPDAQLDALAAKIEHANRQGVLCMEADFLTKTKQVNRSHLSAVKFGFAYVSEAAWKAVLALPAPKGQRDCGRNNITQSDFVAFANELSDYINKAIANGSNKSLRLNVPASFKVSDTHDHFLAMLQEQLDYLLGTAVYVREGETPRQRIENALEDCSRFVFDLDRAPPLYEGLLSLLLRIVIDGDNFLKDIAAKSNLSIRECQDVIYRRVYETKTVFDRLGYLRIKPIPALTELRTGHCDTNYQAKALRAIATAIRAEGAKESGRN